MLLRRLSSLVLTTCLSGLVIGCGSSDDAAAPAVPGSDAATGDAAPEPDASTQSDAVAQQDAAVDGPCLPKTCVQLGAQCGWTVDGCGNPIDCGECASGQSCGGGGPNKCGTNECIPKTCGQLGASCGQVSDGCTSVIDCGWCQAPESCGGGGIDNQCGCTCTLPHAVTQCAGSDCSLVSCVTGWADCNGKADDGCEVDLQTDPNHCGGCFELCLGKCIAGNCECLLPCGGECCLSTEKCCLDSEICVKKSLQCPLPR